MHRHRFDPASSHKLEDPRRQVYMPADKILQLLNLQTGMNVADLGVGTGYFALPMAAAILPGTVYAIDVSGEMLDKLRQKLTQPGSPQNLKLVEAGVERTGLPDLSVDAAFCANVWHELDDRSAALGEIARILKPGGIFVLLDWRDDVERGEFGPPAEERLPLAKVTGEIAAAGWKDIQAGHIGIGSFFVKASRPK